MLPSEPPHDRPAEQLPRVFTELVDPGEEFRRVGLHKVGESWIKTFPKAPLSREETKTMIWNRTERDELIVFQRLARLGSNSATLFLRVGRTRQVAQEVFNRLDHGRQARINFTEIA